MRKELLGAVVIFGLGTAGAVWAQETTDPANPPVVEPTTQPPADNGTAETTTPPATTEAPATDGTAQTTTPPATTEAPATDTGTGTAETTTPPATTEAPATDTGTGTAETTTAPAATDTETEAVATTTEDGETVQEVAPDHLLGTDFIGADVVQSDGTTVGEISDVVIDPDTYVIKNVVIDIGGFLGIGTKTVTLPVEDLDGPNADGDLQVGMTREQIETLPDFVGMPDNDADQVPTMSEPVTEPATTDTTTTQ
jgi:hypothetical protein